ncbi:ROK family protein [Nonomuraea spiralis]|uniref:ROK family protein n=1 Tax=Nonomuraea spiralis TaxID=46182 RepID=A0ABV5IDZ1_9ACTN|nr:ROK family protein [Nonomuraea spiralis]GGS68224.1 transcriptional regulator [Nonomuraea spiralis]
MLAAALDLAADRLAQARAAGMDVVACGVGSAGTVDAKGVVTHATDALPGWRGTDLTTAFADRLGLPVTVLNDVHAWGLGEARHGAAKGSRLALVLTIGTGVGGALVRDGELLRGRYGMAGSLGHTPALFPTTHAATGPSTGTDIDTARPCPCGAAGHLEAYAAGPAILAAYRARGGTAADLRDLAGTADPVALQVIHEAAGFLGRSIAAATTLLDPDVIVLGGGVTGLGDLLTVPLTEAVRRHTPPGLGPIPVRLSTLGPHGAVLGAASAAFTP